MTKKPKKSSASPLLERDTVLRNTSRKVHREVKVSYMSFIAGIQSIGWRHREEGV